MASRTFQFFMTVDETWEALKLLAEKHLIRIYMYNLQDKNVREWSPGAPPPPATMFPLFVFMVDNENPADPKLLRAMPTGESAALFMLFEGQRDNRLYLLDLGAKSDWYDYSMQHHEKPEVLDLHRKLKATLKKRLVNGVVATNIKYGGSSTYKDVWLSPGAIAFYKAGGELMQAGVENVRYAPLEAPEP